MRSFTKLATSARDMLDGSALIATIGVGCCLPGTALSDAVDRWRPWDQIPLSARLVRYTVGVSALPVTLTLGLLVRHGTR